MWLEGGLNLNPKIKKVIDDIERTKAKIAELQALLPELESKRINMENIEIIKLIRSSDISPAALPAALESLKNSSEPTPVPLNLQGATQPVAVEALDSSDDEDSFNTELVSDE